MSTSVRKRSILTLAPLLLTQFPFIQALDVQVDLIYPQNNTITQPVWPFPIIFAFHNFSSGQPQPLFKWSLQRYDSRYSPGYQDPLGDYSWISRDFSTESGSGPREPVSSDKHLVVSAARELGEAREPEDPWALDYHFILGWGCQADGVKYQRGTVFFNLSRTEGARFDAAALPSRGIPLGAFAEVKNSTGQTTDPLCADGYGIKTTPLEDAYMVDDKLVETVNERMVNASGCDNVTWPEGTGRREDKCWYLRDRDLKPTTSGVERTGKTIGWMLLATMFLSLYR